MVLKAGLIALILVTKSKKTRLQKLQQQLKKKPLQSLQLYQLPLKKVFILMFIWIFILGISTVSDQIKQNKQQIRLKYKRQNKIKQYTINFDGDINKQNNSERSKNKQNETTKTYTQHTLKTNISDGNINQKQVLILSQSPSLVIGIEQLLQQQQCNNLQITIKYIKYIYWLILIIIVFTQLQCKSIKISKQHKYMNSNSNSTQQQQRYKKQIKIYQMKSILPLMIEDIGADIQKILNNYSNNGENNSLKIFQRGQQRFTNYTSYYTIQLLMKSITASQLLSQQQQQHPNSVSYQNYIILKRSDIFHARKSMIQLCNVLDIKNVDLKIYQQNKQYSIKNKKNNINNDNIDKKKKKNSSKGIRSVWKWK